MNTETNNTSTCSPYVIWRNYAMGMSSVALVPLLCNLTGKYYIFFTLLLTLALYVFVRVNRKSKYETCPLIPYIAARTLLLFTFASVGMDLYARYKAIWLLSHLPDLSALLLFPIMLILVLMAQRRNMNNMLCMDCMMRNGSPYERAALGHVYFKENRFLLPRIIRTCLLVLIIVWGYTLIEFNGNTYFNVLDRTAYTFVPLIAFGVDILALRMRYYLMGLFEKNDDGMALAKGTKVIRVTIICGNEFYYMGRPETGNVDTPFIKEVPYSDTVSIGLARSLVSDSIDNVSFEDVRFCYAARDFANRRCIEHYFCFLDSREAVNLYEEKIGGKGLWLDKDAVRRYSDNGYFSNMARSEIHRIYVIMLMSKKYNVDGTRKIKIKGYSPTFTLSELRESCIDFNDNRWIILSNIDTGGRFAAIKIWWNKYIEGIF